MVFQVSEMSNIRYIVYESGSLTNSVRPKQYKKKIKIEKINNKVRENCSHNLV